MKITSSKIYSLTENQIINNYLSKLNLNKKESLKFNNDAGYLKFNKSNKIIVTNDSILENIDFFKNDDPKSIAQKITTVNLSDLSSMGAKPYCYTLNLCIPKYISIDWINIFTKSLFRSSNP